MSLVEQLKQKKGFTPTEAAVANYILHHAEDVPHTAVKDLAGSAHVSKAAVIRLCHKLGLEGYRELRVELATELERRRSLLANIDADRPFTPYESSATTLKSVAELEREAIDTCYQSISPVIIDKIAQEIVRAPKVIACAIGDSCLVTELFASKLSKLGIQCVIAGLRSDFSSSIATARSGDVGLFLSYSGLALGGLLGVRGLSGISTLANRGCKTVVVTGLDENDPRVAGADYIVSFQRKESLLGAIGSFYSVTCMEFVLNCVYARVFAHDFEENERSKAMVDSMNFDSTTRTVHT